MKILRATTQETVLGSFAEAEFTSNRHREAVLGWIPTSSDRARLEKRSPDAWTTADRQTAIAAVKKYRGPLLGDILTLNPTWQEVTIESTELAPLRPIDFSPFNAIARDRQLGTLVAAMDSGKETPGDGFSAGYHSLRSQYDPAKVRGRPSVLAASGVGPFVVFEGLTRLSVLESRRAHGESVPDEVPLYLGVTIDAPKWRFFGPPSVREPG
jgi:hypothetical protein